MTIAGYYFKCKNCGNTHLCISNEICEKIDQLRSTEKIKLPCKDKNCFCIGNKRYFLAQREYKKSDFDYYVGDNLPIEHLIIKGENWPTSI